MNDSFIKVETKLQIQIKSDTILPSPKVRRGDRLNEVIENKKTDKNLDNFALPYLKLRL